MATWWLQAIINLTVALLLSNVNGTHIWVLGQPIYKLFGIRVFLLLPLVRTRFKVTLSFQTEWTQLWREIKINRWAQRYLSLHCK